MPAKTDKIPHEIMEGTTSMTIPGNCTTHWSPLQLLAVPPAGTVPIPAEILPEIILLRKIHLVPTAI